MSASGYLDDCNIRLKTEKSVLIEYEGEEIWLPISQMKEVDRIKVGDRNVTVCISEWIAKQKGIETD